MKRKRSSNAVKRLTRTAIIAAMYVALTFISSLAGLASGVIQLRLSEMLTVMPIFFPESVFGLYLGCLLSNILTGCAPWDIVFGSLATLLGAVGAYLLRKLPEKLIWVATLPTTLSNALIVPAVLIYAYGVPDGYFFLMATVGIGELLSATVLGTALYFLIKKSRVAEFIGG